MVMRINVVQKSARQHIKFVRHEASLDPIAPADSFPARTPTYTRPGRGCKWATTDIVCPNLRAHL
eukprot:6175565-Pleurochrysis_carterae.AAC.1